jgi:hypothetical protein
MSDCWPSGPAEGDTLSYPLRASDTLDATQP